MELPTDNNSIIVPVMEIKMEEVPRGVDLFYMIHNSTDIKEILDRGLNGPLDCEKR